MPDFTPSQPEKEQVKLFLPDSNVEIKEFTEYSFNSNFLSAVDGFSFAIGAERLSDKAKAALKPGAVVSLKLNDTVQGTGHIDAIEVSASRGSGSVWRIEGRDKLAQPFDAGADPTKSLKEGQTLADALVSIFTPFGWSSEDQFSISADADRDVKTNAFRSKTATSAGKGFGRKALRAYKLHQSRPYTNESAFEFASRITQRFGLWLWLSADGEKLIVSAPDFDQKPIYALFRNQDGTTNVLDGSVKYDLGDQPTHIVADSYSKGGEFGRGRIKAIYENVAVIAPNADTEAKHLEEYKKAGAKVLTGHSFPASQRMIAPRTRIVYLHDDESQTQEHLEAYIRREMAVHQRKSLTVNYTVEGHGQNTPSGFRIWTVDTTVKVVDEIAGLEETLYVLGRTFNKSRTGGTTTHLELIRLNTLVFSDGSADSK